jgi:formylglycine-generating enzyme required for sulfatase activity
VGGKKPNAWGLYDMHGNVWEWCADWYNNNYYNESPTDDPRGPTGGPYREYRGGGLNYAARNCRSAYRSANDAGLRSGNLGLRVSRVAE